MDVSFFDQETRTILEEADEDVLDSLIQAYDEEPSGDSGHAYFVGYIYFFKHRKTKSVEDLDKALLICKKAVSANSDEGQKEATPLINLTGILATKFEQSKDVEFMEEAVITLETALSCDDGDPIVISSMTSNLLAIKYLHTLANEDLELALTYAEVAYDIAPDEYLEILPLTGNLVKALTERYKATDSSRDLEKAIELATRRTTGRSDLVAFLLEQLCLRFKQKRVWIDLNCAAELFRANLQGPGASFSLVIEQFPWTEVLLKRTVADFDTILFGEFLRGYLQRCIASSPNLIPQFSEFHKKESLEQVWQGCLDCIIARMPPELRNTLPEKPNIFRDLFCAEEIRGPDSRINTNEEDGACYVIVVLADPDPSAPVKCVRARVQFQEIRELDSKQGYDVLTSVWDDSETSIILLDLKHVSVPKNLESALKRLRLQSGPQALWIDVLCLNDESLQDLLKVTRHMKRVYHHAQKVHVWLGGEFETYDPGLRFLYLIKRTCDDKDDISSVLEECPKEDVLQAMLYLLTRPWWDRAAVLEELLRGCNIQLIYGTVTGPLQDLSVLLSAVYEIILPSMTGGFVKRYPEVDQVFSQMPTDLVSIATTGIEPEGLVLRKLDGVSSSITRILHGPNMDLNWILAFLKVVTNIGGILTAMAIKLSAHYTQRRRLEFFMQTNSEGGGNISAASSSQHSESPAFWAILGDGPGHISLRMVSRHAAERAKEFSRQRRNFAREHLKGWQKPGDFAKLSGPEVEGLEPHEQYHDTDFWKNAAGVEYPLRMPEEESAEDIMKRWAVEMTLSREQKVRPWVERFKEAKLDVLERLKTIVNEDFADKLLSNDRKGKGKLELQKLDYFFPKHEQADILDVHYWIRILEVFSVSQARRSHHRTTASGIAGKDLVTRGSRTTFETSYIYEPLDVDNQEIRILVLEPSSNPVSDLHGRLIRLSMKTLSTMGVLRFPFAALSYVWGAPEPAKSIFLHGKKMNINPNLFHALKRLRDPWIPTLLWIDALCINQHDDKEKSSQIPLMGDIYCKAGHVFMWVGEEDHGSGHALLPLILSDLEDLLNDHGMSTSCRKKLYELETYSATLEHNVALHDILQRPYWTRAWIAQEVLLAESATICCGSYVASWRSILDVCGCNGVLDHLTNLAYNSGHILPHAGRLGRIYTRERAFPGTMKFLDALSLGRTLSASVPHDYLYAFLGITKLGSDQLVPEYTKPLESVCKDAFQVTLSQQNELDVLSHCKRYESEEDFEKAMATNWPSWLPDWSEKNNDGDPSKMTSLLTSVARRNYEASAERTGQVLLSEDRKLLTVHAILFDSVEVVSKHYWPNSVEEDWTMYRQWLTQRQIDSYPTSHSQRLALAQTTFLGQATVGKIPSFGLSLIDEDSLIEDAEKKLDLTFPQDLEEPPHPKRVVLSAIDEANAEKSMKIGQEKSYSDQVDEITDWFHETLDGRSMEPRLKSFHHSGLFKSSFLDLSYDNSDVDRIKEQCSKFASKFFATSLGYIGRGPVPMRARDSVFILLGAKVPFILREDESTGHYRLVGEAYVHGIMGGEVLQGPGKVTEITIV